jgi:hypothetical protein
MDLLPWNKDTAMAAGMAENVFNVTSLFHALSRTSLFRVPRFNTFICFVHLARS